MSTEPSSSWIRQLWKELRADPSFRATFVFAILAPTSCVLGVVAWVVLTILRGA